MNNLTATAVQIEVLIPRGAGVLIQRQVNALRTTFDVATIECDDDIRFETLGYFERIYRWLDTRLFASSETLIRESRAAARDHAVDKVNEQVSLLATGMSASTPGLERLAVGTISVTYDGRAAPYLEEAVRARLGTPGGTVLVAIWSGEGHARRLMSEGRCALDHRSLTRSVGWVAAKLPALLHAALVRSRRQASPHPLAADPSTRSLSAIALLRRTARNVAIKLFFQDQWRLQLHAVNRAKRGIAGELRAMIDPPRDRFWADPFLIERDGTSWLFFEELLLGSPRAHLSVVDLDPIGRVRGEVRTVLREPYHLSYPFLWEEDARLYMIPESSENGTIDLYACESFPTEWNKVATLVHGCYADATVVRYQGRLWMFATHSIPEGSLYDELHLFWADDIAGPWTSHPLNPVKIDARSSRPAGCMWVEAGELFRPTQDCSSVYGGRVNIQRVVALNESDFKEADADRGTDPPRVNGRPFHTVNALNDWLIVDVLHRVLHRRLLGRRRAA